MRSPHRLAAGLIVAALAVAPLACSSDDGGAAPRSTTTAPKGTVDVDIDSDNPSVEYTDPDGNTSQFGEGADLPDGWPEGIVPPTSITVVSSSTAQADGKTQLFVTGESTSGFDDVYQAIKAQLTAAGFEIDNDLGDPNEGFAGIEASKGDTAVSVTMSGDTDAEKVTVLYTVTPPKA